MIEKLRMGQKGTQERNNLKGPFLKLNSIYLNMVVNIVLPYTNIPIEILTNPESLLMSIINNFGNLQSRILS